MKSVSYKKILHKKLDDPEQAAEYLTACYEEGREVFLVGLRDVVQAQGGVACAAELSKPKSGSLLGRKRTQRNAKKADWEAAGD
jgi:DNA-binding phage protein